MSHDTYAVAMCFYDDESLCFCFFTVSTTAFYKEQPVTEFLAEVIEESQGGAGRGSNRGRGNDRGRGGDRGRGRGRGGYDTRGGDRVQPRVIPTHLNDTQRRVLAKEIKG